MSNIPSTAPNVLMDATVGLPVHVALPPATPSSLSTGENAGTSTSTRGASTGTPDADMCASTRGAASGMHAGRSKHRHLLHNFNNTCNSKAQYTFCWNLP